MFSPERLMELAIERCREGIAAGQAPFGCAIAQGERLLAVEHNTVLADDDPTSHGEIHALRVACRSTGRVTLPGAVVATTCEPCPMCAAALYWSGVETIYYGAAIADATAAGFGQIQLPAAEVLQHGKQAPAIIGGLLAEECRELFAIWQSRQLAEG